MRRTIAAIILATLPLLIAPVVFGKLSDEKFEQLKRKINSTLRSDPKSACGDILEIAKDDSERAVKYLIGINRRALDNHDIIAALEQAFTSMRSDEARRKIIASAPKAVDYRIRILLIDTMKMFSGPDVQDALVRCLDDRHEPVVLSALRVLGVKGTVTAIEPLIQKMEELSKKNESGSRIYLSLIHI